MIGLKLIQWFVCTYVGRIESHVNMRIVMDIVE